MGDVSDGPGGSGQGGLEAEAGHDLQGRPLVTEQVLLGGSRSLIAVRTAEESLVRPAVQVVEDDLPHGVGGGVEAVVGVSVGGEDSVEMRDQTGGELEDWKERVISVEMVVCGMLLSHPCQR